MIFITICLVLIGLVLILSLFACDHKWILDFDGMKEDPIGPKADPLVCVKCMKRWDGRH